MALNMGLQSLTCGRCQRLLQTHFKTAKGSVSETRQAGPILASELPPKSEGNVEDGATVCQSTACTVLSQMVNAKACISLDKVE